MNLTCQICSNQSANETYLCREKMLGRGDPFSYFQCGRCGCLQIVRAPSDLQRFYSGNYYSFHLPAVPEQGWKSHLAGIRDLSALTSRGWIGKLVNRYYPANEDVTLLGRLPLRLNSNVLDVGCGNGTRLGRLYRAGLKHLTGIDPFLPGDLQPLPGLHLRKQSLDQVTGQFDVIMLHHVFEHVPDGLETLKLCCERLADDGKLLLRFPTADSQAWQRYRENWVQLDAPRHLFLHTRCSFELIAGKAGLKINEWYCDSTAFQFYGSELYQQGVPLVDQQGKHIPPENYFSPSQMAAFADQAKQVNAAGRGDQVVVLLSRNEAAQ